MNVAKSLCLMIKRTRGVIHVPLGAEIPESDQENTILKAERSSILGRITLLRSKCQQESMRKDPSTMPGTVSGRPCNLLTRPAQP